ncbi:MAG TPA: extracellular solute-binding protein, partial [Microlunatus sp.]
KNSTIGGASLWVMKGQKPAEYDAVAAFLDYLAKPETQVWWHKATGYVPIVKAAADTKIVKDLQASDPNYLVAMNQLKNAKTADRISWFQSAVTEINQSMTKIYGDNTPAADVVKTLKPKLDEIMEKNKSDLDKVINAS